MDQNQKENFLGEAVSSANKAPFKTAFMAVLGFYVTQAFVTLIGLSVIVGAVAVYCLFIK